MIAQHQFAERTIVQKRVVCNLMGLFLTFLNIKNVAGLLRYAFFSIQLRHSKNWQKSKVSSTFYSESTLIIFSRKDSTEF
jgi:hypothetical protein